MHTADAEAEAEAQYSAATAWAELHARNPGLGGDPGQRAAVARLLTDSLAHAAFAEPQPLLRRLLERLSDAPISAELAAGVFGCAQIVTLAPAHVRDRARDLIVNALTLPPAQGRPR